VPAEPVAAFRVLLATDESVRAHVAELWVSRLRWSRPCIVAVAARRETRRLEPDGVALLAAYVLLLGAVWATAS
jgi:hypothetical protein